MIRPNAAFRAAAVALLLSAAGGATALPGPAFAQDADGVVAEGPTTVLVVTTETGVYPFDVELANTEESRSRGLMYRRSLEPDRGMLFDMGGDGPATFWMENTYVSLDIVFIDRAGRVVNVAADAQPMSRALIQSAGPVRFVLEVKAGTAARIGLKPGDLVRHPLIGNG